MSGFSGETESIGCVYIFILRNWLSCDYGGSPASPKSAGWAGRLETQERAVVAV